MALKMRSGGPTEAHADWAPNEIMNIFSIKGENETRNRTGRC